jgi:single-stranded-DNA-specific exonuclease
MSVQAKLFLNVENSLCGQRWLDRLDAAANLRAQSIVQQHGIADILARILAARGQGPEGAAAFLEPTVRALMPDPSTLVDMDSAAERLLRAVKAGETVAIFGDYDVDGASSSALLGGFLEACGTPYIIHIPDRIFEGYGPNAEAIRALAGQGATLLVTVDCGTTSFEPFEEARRLGLDVVVLDHHQAPEDLPKVQALVNPNRQDDLSGLGHLCAAGVVFMTIVALNRALRTAGFWNSARREPDLLATLDLVALATVADVVPLTGLNRAFVRTGLQVMGHRGRPGLRALFDVAGADGPPRAQALGFMIGPRINAGGRIGDAALGAKLLLLQDDGEASGVARELDRLNRERQALEVQAVAEAEAEALAALGLSEAGPCVITGSENWHPGIVGLVAARLKERFNRPAFAIAFQGKIGTGSGRSIAGADLGRSVRTAVSAGILVKGGGHAMAAGITLDRSRLGDFRAFMDETLQAPVDRALRDSGLHIDAALTAGGANPALIHEVEKAGPFGSGNPEPVFAFPEHRIVDVGEVGNGHVRVRAAAGDNQTINAIAFRAATRPLGQALLKSRGRRLHLAGCINIDRWGGQERVQLRIQDAADPDDNPAR